MKSPALEDPWTKNFYAQTKVEKVETIILNVIFSIEDSKTLQNCLQYRQNILQKPFFARS